MEMKRAKRLEEEKKALSNLIEKLQVAIKDVETQASEEKNVLQCENEFLRQTLA
jgi:hypothetical protein